MDHPTADELHVATNLKHLASELVAQREQLPRGPMPRPMTAWHAAVFDQIGKALEQINLSQMMLTSTWGDQYPVRCARCLGTGRTDQRECPECEGYGTIANGRPCVVCHGRGWLLSEPCPGCDGNGYTPYVYEDGTVNGGDC